MIKDILAWVGVFWSLVFIAGVIWVAYELRRAPLRDIDGEDA